MLLALACAMALAVLAYADQRLSNMGWWLFVALALSIGMFHGALDALLLLREFSPSQKGSALLFKTMFLYLFTVVAVGAVLSQSLTLALLALLAMSIWHFGEPYGRWPSRKWAARLTVGGASVMLPVLLSPVAMHALLGQLFGSDAPLVWLVWQGLAWAWLAFSLVQLLLMWRGQLPGAMAAAVEVAAVAVLNALLSPLTTFALYFGVYHSASHVLRVLRTQTATGKRALAQPLLWVTVVATALLMFLLGWYLLPVLQSVDILQTKVLHWLIVMLAAATLPHLLLVSRCAPWLQTRP